MNFGKLGAALLLCAIAFAAVTLPPFAQPQSYHRFADTRALFGIPNFLDVVSNLALLAAAVPGLFVLRSASFIHTAERIPYAVFFLAAAATAFGSAWYHLAPDNDHLFWDRLPIAMGLAALLSAVIAERRIRTGLLLLPPLLMVGAGTASYWLWSEETGAGNVLPYFAFQLDSLLAILLLTWLFPSPYNRSADLYRATLLYGIALIAELLDRPIFAMGGVMGGHALKHLLAAAAMYQIVRMLRLRTRI